MRLNSKISLCLDSEMEIELTFAAIFESNFAGRGTNRVTYIRPLTWADHDILNLPKSTSLEEIRLARSFHLAVPKVTYSTQCETQEALTSFS